MEREMLNWLLEKTEHLEGGTKEACIKAREFLHYARNSENRIYSPVSCVSAEEFIESVETLMAFAFRQSDTIPEKWKCDSDCRLASNILCPGECNISKTAYKKCPFFMDEGLI